MFATRLLALSIVAAITSTATAQRCEWREVHPSTHPSARSEYGMVYDSARRVVVLFGGRYQSAYLNDTWLYDGATWTLAQPSSSSPTPRSRCAMAYDPIRGKIVLIGGETFLGVPLDDTWEWDGAGWHQVATSTHGVAVGGAACYDPVLGGTFFNVGQTNMLWRGGSWSYLNVPNPTGGNLTMLATNLAPGQPAFHLVGSSDTVWGSLSLPFDLAPIGAPGCAILAAPEIIESVGTSGAGGDLRFTIVLPDDVRLVGAQFFHQLVGMAPGLNRADLIVSNAGAGTLGTR